MGPKGMLSIKSQILNLGAKEEVILRIRDSGPGISAELQEKIFEPFYTTKSEGHGTGLGLSLSRDIVRKFNGEITVRSPAENLDNQNPGAEFIIHLPVIKKRE
jgi:two-component system NtrC family sensor kinase